MKRTTIGWVESLDSAIEDVTSPPVATDAATPMAATIRLAGGTAQVTPWLIDYKRFNDPARNQFFASPPEIEHKVG